MSEVTLYYTGSANASSKLGSIVKRFDPGVDPHPLPTLDWRAIVQWPLRVRDTNRFRVLL